MLLLSSEDIHTRNYESFSFQRRSSPIAVYLTGHLAAALLEKKPANSGYLPWYMTDDGVVLQHSDCKWIVIVVALTVNWQLLSNTRRPYFLVNVMSTNGTLDAKGPRHSSADLCWLTLPPLQLTSVKWRHLPAADWTISKC